MRHYKIRVGLESILNKEYPITIDGLNTRAVDKNGCEVRNLDIVTDDRVIPNEKFGDIDSSYIHFKILLTQESDDMGLFTDFPYIESDNTQIMAISPYYRVTGASVESYYSNVQGVVVEGLTDDKLDQVKSYYNNSPFIENFNMAENQSKEWTGVLEIKDQSVVYVVGGEIAASGAYVPQTGVVYETFFNRTRPVEYQDVGTSNDIPYTTFKAYIQGFNENNISLSELLKEEKFFGVAQKPRIVSDILIDRGNVNVMERHLRLSEITSVNQLENYAGGFYNIV